MKTLENLDNIKNLAIIWYSRTGASEALAKAAQHAALAEVEVEAALYCAPNASAQHLLDADGYIFICPENLAAIAGGMKEFFDRCYYPVLGKIEGRPYAAIIAAGSDGENARRQLERIATGWRLKKIMDSQIICTDAQSQKAILAPKILRADQLNIARQAGATLAAGLSMGVF
jgi:multimeric flavodoxin WrbA